MPLDLEARGFEKRPFQPSAKWIPAEELRLFYDTLGQRMAVQTPQPAELDRD
jgi:hypothetical protein